MTTDAVAATESPIERLLLGALAPRLAPSARLVPQFSVETICGAFRLDFALEFGSKRIGLECDGADFHNDWRDEWRDALILGSGQVDEMLRFRGKDLCWHLDDCLFALSRLHPKCFSEQGLHISERLASDNAKSQIHRYEEDPRESLMFGYQSDLHPAGFVLRIFRRWRADRKHAYWKELWDFASRNPGISLSDVMAKWEAARPWPSL